MNQPETTAGVDEFSDDGGALRRELAAAGAERRAELLRDTVRTQTAALLEHSSIEDDSNFLEHGITSIKALELTRNLMTLTDVEVPLVAIIEHPTPAELAQYIDDALVQNGGGHGVAE